MADQALKDQTTELKCGELMKHAYDQYYSPTEDDAVEKTHPGHYAMDNCIKLFQLDFDVETIDNKGARLCSHYPSQIILMGEKGSAACSISGKGGRRLTLGEARDELQVLMQKAADCRCRSRFVTPVIYFNGQYVCRSATLAGSKELYAKMGLESAKMTGEAVASAVASTAGTVASAVASTAETVASSAVEAGAMMYEAGMELLAKYTSSLFWQQKSPEKRTLKPAEPLEAQESGEKTACLPEGETAAVALRKEGRKTPVPEDSKKTPAPEDSEKTPAPDDSEKTPETAEEAKAAENEVVSPMYVEYFENTVKNDKELLSMLNVRHICDLMVEDAKVKYNMTFSSSEKADEQQRYQDFKLYSFPYPGCEFFADWKANNRRAEGLFYDWKGAQNTAVLKVGDESSMLRQMDIDWDKHKEWDLEQITLNYVRALVRLLAAGGQGLLVHCISGWDRTPLFTSLLRLSLWADGVIHPSLEPAEMMYLTLAYDWYLFGHDLKDRRRKGQEVLPFCFYVLPKLVDDRFSVHSYGPFSALDSEVAASALQTSAENQGGVGEAVKGTTPKGQSPTSTSGRRASRSPAGAAAERPGPTRTRSSQRLAPARTSPYPVPQDTSLKSRSAIMSPVKGATSRRACSHSPAKTAASHKADVLSPAKTASHDADVLSPVKTGAGPVLESPSKQLTDLSAHSLVKRLGSEGDSKGSTPPAKKVSEFFAPIGEQIRVQVATMTKAIEKLPKRSATENVDPNIASKTKGKAPSDDSKDKDTSSGATEEEEGEQAGEEEPATNKDDSFREDFEEITGNEWRQLPLRHRKLMAVHYIFRNVQARCEGLTLPDDIASPAWSEFVFGSGSTVSYPQAGKFVMGLFSRSEPDPEAVKIGGEKKGDATSGE